MTEYAIEIEGLTKVYGTKAVVDGISLAVPTGAVYGFLGPNGAGKTTTIRMLLGLIHPSSGSARVLGRVVTGPGGDRAHLAAHVGAIVETPSFYSRLSGRRNLEVLRLQSGRRVDRGRIDELLELVGLTSRADDPAGSFSLGMRQRLGIAAALLNSPAVVFLDEPTNGLDPAGTKEIRDVLKRLAANGTTVFLCSHLLAEVEATCSHAAILSAGTLRATGRIEELVGATAGYEFEVSSAARAAELLARGERSGRHCEVLAPGRLSLAIGRHEVSEVLRLLLREGVEVYAVSARRNSLEEVFLETTRTATAGPAHAREVAAR